MGGGGGGGGVDISPKDCCNRDPVILHDPVPVYWLR